MTKLGRIGETEIRLLLAFERFTGIKTIECFEFNNNVVYIVNPALAKILALKKNKKNLERLARFLNRKVKVLAAPKKNKASIQKFLNALLEPYAIKSLFIKRNMAIINAGKHKAFLLGKNKKNLPLLKDLFNKYFGIDEIKIR
jgi:hypothetical protein